MQGSLEIIFRCGLGYLLGNTEIVVVVSRIIGIKGLTWKEVWCMLCFKGGGMRKHVWVVEIFLRGMPLDKKAFFSRIIARQFVKNCESYARISPDCNEYSYQIHKYTRDE